MTACVGCSRSSGRNRNLVDYLPTTQRQARPPRVRPHKPPALLAERISSTTAPHVTTPPLNACVHTCASAVLYDGSAQALQDHCELFSVRWRSCLLLLPCSRCAMECPNLIFKQSQMFIFLQNSFACITSQFEDDHFITPD